MSHTYTHIFLASPWIFFLILKTFGCSLRGLETFREKKEQDHSPDCPPSPALPCHKGKYGSAHSVSHWRVYSALLGESPLLFHMCAFSLFILAYYILAKGCYGFSFFLFCFVGYRSFNIEMYYVFVFTVLKMYVLWMLWTCLLTSQLSYFVRN